MPPPKAIRQVSEAVWEIPAASQSGMRVPARLYATRKLLDAMDAGVFEQITHVAALPGIERAAVCMADGHWGYGFPIGGMAAMDPESGVISPGGIGFDINCGMRLVRTNLTLAEVQPRLKKLVEALFNRVPSGVGSSGMIKTTQKEFCDLVERGAAWCVERGFGWAEDLERTEDGGCMRAANAGKVSRKAIERGYDQVGTLGSGNHYLEIQVLRPENVFDRERAAVFGLTLPDQVVVMFHCGSRGFGHQVATDHLQALLDVMARKYQLSVPDRQLACAPFASPEGQAYFAAMACAVNMAFANRQAILNRIREVFGSVFGRDPADLDMHQIYDVSHNTAKLEDHLVDGHRRKLLVHRKGATRALPPGADGLPEAYRRIGQPVIIGGSMETGSYLLTGVPEGAEAFFTTAHGSGRTMSRNEAKSRFNGRQLQRDLEARGIHIRTASYAGLAEEAGAAYKNIDDVVDAARRAGVSHPVARFVPIGNIKG